jgi:hypothetical protein
MKQHQIGLITICLFLISFISTAQVHVTIVNKSDVRMDSVTVNNVNVGTLNISKDTSIIYKELWTDTGYAIVKANANILGGQKIFNSAFTECGTMVRPETSGKYTLNLTVLQNSTGPYLYIEYLH